MLQISLKNILLITLCAYFISCSKPKGKEHELIVVPAYAVLLDGLVNELPDSNYHKAVAIAYGNYQAKGGDFVSHFGDAWGTVAGEKRLAAPSLFGTYKNAKSIDPYKTTNPEVLDFIRKYFVSILDSCNGVLKERITKATGTEPAITVDKNNLALNIEFYTNNERKPIDDLILTQGNVELLETYNNSEIYPLFQEADNRLSAVLTLDPALRMEAYFPQAAYSDSAFAKDKKEHPLLILVAPNVVRMQDSEQLTYATGAMCGSVLENNISVVERYLQIPQVKATFPPEIVFLWDVKPVLNNNTDIIYSLYAIKQGNKLTGKFTSEAGLEPNNYNNTSYDISVKMNAEAAVAWGRLTRNSVGKAIAIVIDGRVYSAPIVNEPITNGRSTISGNFTKEEAQTMVYILESGPLPVQLIRIK